MTENDKYTILYVDDEESNLRIFKNTFRKQYNVITALSGNEGLEKLAQENVDLILTDQRMPGMSGLDFLKIAVDKFPELNRILITAYSDYDILREAVNELKIFQYVEKPWKEEDIKSTINSALEIHRLKMENMKLTNVLQKSNDDLVKINETLVTEIEKHKITQQALISEKEYAERCNMLKTSFLANMSHEVRTPMNSIIGFSGLLNEPNISPEKRVSYIDIIQNSCNQLLNIVNDIVEISKIETGNIEIRNTKIEVNPILIRLQRTFQMVAQKKGLEFETKLNDNDRYSTVYADSAKLEQVIANLLINAIKFTAKGKISLGAHFCDGEIIFHVSDTGIGIAKENFKYIFERFSQVEPSSARKFGGNGLGLAISKAYIDKMNGKIWVESELDKGSTFYFSLQAML